MIPDAMNKYNASDIMHLYKIYSDEPSNLFSSINLYDKLIEPLKHIIQNAVPDEQVINNLFYDYIKSIQPKDRKCADLSDFIFYTPIKETPLYINDPELSFWAKWRLYIAK